MQQFVVEDTYKVCYAWLRLLAAYHELDMFSGLTVQTESTIERAVQAFREFDLRLSVGQYLPIDLTTLMNWHRSML